MFLNFPSCFVSPAHFYRINTIFVKSRICTVRIGIFPMYNEQKLRPNILISGLNTLKSNYIRHRQR